LRDVLASGEISNYPERDSAHHCLIFYNDLHERSLVTVTSCQHKVGVGLATMG
jgi:hypothetical protein